LAHRKWIDDLVEKSDGKRDIRWSESIAVESIQCTEQIKTAMEATARGRTIRLAQDCFELR
jgi:hypothetical protein